jgi:AcrR family transcriptional regulator
MEEIASSVGIKKASLYNHFRSKEAMLEEIYRRLRETVLPQAEPARPAPPRWSNATEVFERVLRDYFEAWAAPRVDLSWTIVSEQQYVDARAAAMIFDMTEHYLDKTEWLFESLRAQGLLRFTGEARGRAETFAYAIRSMHLEYGLRKRHGLNTDVILSRMNALAARFAAD